MARPKKYSGENFLKEMMLLRDKYKRMATPEFSWAIGKFLGDSFLDWNDIMDSYTTQFYSEEEPLRESLPESKVKKTKKVRKKK